ncbi:MAG: ATP-dependent DNA ligase [Planctomycetia bacterium]|nr:ATP-dependent DNA ligase [Planctomycetia bacterium]
MEARPVEELPTGDEWQYEPKWDGFRCLAFRDGKKVTLQSKSGQSLGRYFPEVTESLLALRASRFVLDGELVIPIRGKTSFEQLQQRVHPTATRVNKLASEFPAIYIVFDLLVDEDGTNLSKLPLSVRRSRLEQFKKSFFARKTSIRLSPATSKFLTAKKWGAGTTSGLDGVMAKRLDSPYRSGSRDGMQKFKRRHSVDCVVGGFRYAEGTKVVGSLLLGLYDDQGLLHHIGFTSSFSAAEREQLLGILKPLIGGTSFTGKAPGGPSRWSTKRSSEWTSLRPKIVAEVEFDSFTGGRFRHGTNLLRFRPDKAAKQCKFDQLGSARGTSLKLLKS